MNHSPADILKALKFSKLLHFYSALNLKKICRFSSSGIFNNKKVKFYGICLRLVITPNCYTTNTTFMLFLRQVNVASL